MTHHQMRIVIMMTFVLSMSILANSQTSDIQLAVTSLREDVRLGEATVLPAIVSLNSLRGTRTNVDLVCVIDVSGSMSGQKLELLKETMKYLIETLSSQDRLSIVTFSHTGRQLCDFTKVNKDNTKELNKHINGLVAAGGTNIMSGMEIAFETLRGRRNSNHVSSVFLLSDGEDNVPGAVDRLKQALKRRENSQLGAFSLHTFGFGSLHDENLMNEFSLEKDGSYYFIKDIETLDLAFANALGGIFSVSANEVIVHVREIGTGVVQGVNIKKVLGDKWQKIREGYYKIKLTQLMSQVSKDFVFEIEIPKILGETGRYPVIEVLLYARGLEGQTIQKSAKLFLNLIGSSQIIDEEKDNIKVIQNHYRVQAAETIKGCTKKVQENDFVGARKDMQELIGKIKKDSKAKGQMTQDLLLDLQMINQNLDEEAFNQEQEIVMLEATNTHFSQSNMIYGNNQQKNMVKARAEMKKK